MTALRFILPFAALLAAPLWLGCGESAPKETPRAPAPAEQEGGPEAPVATREAAPEATPPAATDAPPEAARPFLARIGDDDGVDAVQLSEAVRARLTERGAGPSPQLIDETLDELIETKLLAAAARAERFAKPDEPEAALAARFLASKIAGDQAAPVTDAEIDGYFAERRRAAIITVPTRAVGNEVQRIYNEVRAERPAELDRVFRDLQAKFDLNKGKQRAGEKTPFDPAGRAASGDQILPHLPAMGAFAMNEVDQLSPPIEGKDGRSTLVRLLHVQPAIGADARTPEALDKAKKAVLERRAVASRRDYLARLRRKGDVTIDTSSVKLFHRAFLRRMASDTRKLKPPGGIQKWDRRKMLTPTRKRVDGIVDEATMKKLEALRKKQEGTP